MISLPSPRIEPFFPVGIILASVADRGLKIIIYHLTNQVQRLGRDTKGNPGTK